MSPTTIRRPATLAEKSPHGLDDVLQELGALRIEMITHFDSVEGRIVGLESCFSRRSKSHLTVEEIAAITGRTAYTIRRWIKEGRLKAQRLTEGGPKGRLLIPREELDRLVAGGLGENVSDTLLH